MEGKLARPAVAAVFAAHVTERVSSRRQLARIVEMVVASVAEGPVSCGSVVRHAIGMV